MLHIYTNLAFDKKDRLSKFPENTKSNDIFRYSGKFECSQNPGVKGSTVY